MNLPEWLLQISLLLGIAVLTGVFAQRLRLPLTVLLAVIGFLAAWLGGTFGIRSPLDGETFEEVVVLVFLPVLVFEAAMGLSTRAFFRNLGPIMALAIPALVISAALVGSALTWVLHIPLTAALVFGVLISATDPVAVVAVFRKLGVPGRLLTLVEGESLLNDGVAIVLFNILLVAALGDRIDVTQGFIDFLAVFFGGATIGLIPGLIAALLLPWLDRFQAATLSLALAYGGFILAEHVFGFSGVMATLTAGVTLRTFAASRASEAVRDLWHELWESLGYIANALLFLLIGLTIDPALIIDNLGAISLAIVTVLIARTLAVVPIMALLERLAHIPPVGWRNEAVVIWGGLRGGVALALALSLPETLAERELFIAMTGGVVLATLLINATTIGALVRKLALDQPDRTDRFLAAGAILSGIAAARRRLQRLKLTDPVVEGELDAAEQNARTVLAGVRLRPDEEQLVVIRRGLFVERETYQHLSDAGVLPPSVTRTLLHEVDDHIEEVNLDRVSLETARRRQRPLFDRSLERLLGWLPRPVGEDAAEVAYAEASARRLAARRTIEALELFKQLPNISDRSVEAARQNFRKWEQQADATLSDLDKRDNRALTALRRRQAETLSRVASTDALAELTTIGLLPETIADRAATAVITQTDEYTRSGTAPQGHFADAVGRLQPDDHIESIAGGGRLSTASDTADDDHLRSDPLYPLISTLRKGASVVDRQVPGLSGDLNRLANDLGVLAAAWHSKDTARLLAAAGHFVRHHPSLLSGAMVAAIVRNWHDRQQN